MRFGLIYKINSYCFGPIFRGCHQGPITSTGPASFNPVSWAWESGSARLFFKPNKEPLLLCYFHY